MELSAKQSLRVCGQKPLEESWLCSPPNKWAAEGCYKLQLPARLILAVTARPARTVSATVVDLVRYRYKALEIRQ